MSPRAAGLGADALPGLRDPGQRDTGLRDTVATGETALLRELVAICGHLSTLAAQTTELTLILQILADAVGCAAAVVDNEFSLLGSAPAAEPSEIVEQLRGGPRHSPLGSPGTPCR